jgi:hypothetical protein
MQSFAKKVISSRKGYIYEIHGKDSTGTKAYYFVLVDNMQLQKFKMLLKAGSLDILKLGKVLAKGFGHNPPDIIRQGAIAKSS